jgi:hypothetical protein
MPIKNLIRFSQPRLLGNSDPEGIRDYETLKSAQQLTNDWMKLSTFVTGVLSGPRGFTWWTPANLASNTYYSCHTIGLPDNWIPVRAVILRCDTTALPADTTFVPNILNGFDSPIFFATRDSDVPILGRAIDLNVTPLELGDFELVCPPIAVDRIQIRAFPLGARNPLSPRVSLRSILQLLPSFYQSQ